MTVARRTLLGAALAGLFGPGRAVAQPTAVGPLVFAAASLKTALDDVAGLWAEGGRPAPRIAYAGSNALARQIEAGAPADLFLSADLDWMDHLAARGLIRAETRVHLLGSTLVLVAPKASTVALELRPGLDLAGALGPGGRLATANVEAVPAGRYGKAALERLGAWDAVKGRLAGAENVRAALLLVSRGEAPLGIVYATDAAAEPNVRVVAAFPADSHPPIVYPAALTRDAAHPDAGAFLAFLRGPVARAAFERRGFTVLNRPAPSSS